MGLHSALRPLWWAYTQHWGHYDGPNARVCYVWDRSQTWCKTSAIISADNAVSVKRWQWRFCCQSCASLLISDLGRVSCLTSGVQGRDIWHLSQDGQRHACLLPGVSWHCWPVGRGLVSSFLGVCGKPNVDSVSVFKKLNHPEFSILFSRFSIAFAKPSNRLSTRVKWKHMHIRWKANTLNFIQTNNYAWIVVD